MWKRSNDGLTGKAEARFTFTGFGMLVEDREETTRELVV